MHSLIILKSCVKYMRHSSKQLGSILIMACLLLWKYRKSAGPKSTQNTIYPISEERKSSRYVPPNCVYRLFEGIYET